MIQNSIEKLNNRLIKYGFNGFVIPQKKEFFIDEQRLPDDLAILVNAVPDNGIQFDIGSNMVKFIGTKYIEDIQYQYLCLEEVESAGGVTFLSQYDVHPVFYATKKTQGFIYEMVAAGDKCYLLASSLCKFLDILSEILDLTYEDFGGQISVGDDDRILKEDFTKKLKSILNYIDKEADYDGWYEYFFG
jgi:hypothetical protein